MSLVEHDAIIGSFTHVSTKAIVNGNAEIGEMSFGKWVDHNTSCKAPPKSIIKAGSLFK